MEPRTLQYLAEACAGELCFGSPHASVSRVCTDSRKVQAGDLFVALAGDRFDGHEFLAQAAAKGAVGVLAERGRAPAGFTACAVILVENPRLALGRLAARYRLDFSPAMIAVAGSNGKTTTKELVAAVLRQKLATVSSQASFNNDVGVPTTLLELETRHQAAVVEAGTNHPGELEPLLRMIRPEIGVLTCIGREHLEFFGDLAGVVREEGSLAEVLPATGKLLLNGDDSWADTLAQRSRAQVIRLGFGASNQWRVESLSVGKNGSSMQVAGPLPAFCGEYRFNLVGRHQAVNALFAVVLGAELGLSRSEVEQGLVACQPPRMRLETLVFNGVRVLDDAYNANADSMAAALQTLGELPCKGRRVAVLGDMAELGAHSEAAHEEVGRRAAESGVGQLFAVGKMAAVMARGARAAGLTRIFEFAEVEPAAAALKRFVRTGDVVLLKASRATRLERVTELLRGGESATKN